MEKELNFEFYYTVQEPGEEPKSYRLEMKGSRAQVLKNLKANFILPNHHFYNLTRKGFTEFKSGHNLVRFDLKEVTGE